MLVLAFGVFHNRFDHLFEMRQELKPKALDLAKGLGGWTKGLKAAGWYVVGVDIEDWSRNPNYVEPDDFIQADLREVDNLVQTLKARFGKFDLAVASPPCQEFSALSLPFFSEKRKSGFQPDKSIWKACERIAAELGVPLVLENVRGAERYMGHAAWHCGPFYLWGNVPALMPVRKWPKKEIDISFKKDGSGKRILAGPRAFNSKSKLRKEWSAKAAMIPEELALWIGECFYPREAK